MVVPAKRASLQPMHIVLAVILLAAAVFGVVAMHQKNSVVKPPSQTDVPPVAPVFKATQVGTPWVNITLKDSSGNEIKNNTLKKGTSFTYAIEDVSNCYLYLILKESSEAHGVLIKVPADNYFTKGTLALVCRTEHDRPELVVFKEGTNFDFKFLEAAGRPGLDQMFVVASPESRISWLEDIPTEKLHQVADTVIENSTKYLSSTKYPKGIEISEKAIAGSNFDAGESKQAQNLYISVLEMKHE
ncbi:MAG TPA: hypothetical protein V6C72_06015 [Chroococcales cyanobacterium]